MPAILRPTNFLHTRDATDPNTPPPFPPFHNPDTDNDGSSGPFPIDPNDHDEGLSPGIIAAILVSIFVFFLIVTGLLALLSRHRRRAKEDEIALKEETRCASVSEAATSGALDPPPPYEEVHGMSQHHAREQRWDSGSGVTREEEEGSMGPHATITDGIQPGRHSGLEVR